MKILSMQGHLIAMDIYENRLKPLARAADACGVGPMLQILPGGLDNLTINRIESGRSWLRDASEAQVEDTDLLSSFYDDDLDWTPPLAQDTSLQSPPSLQEATSAGEDRNEDQADGISIGTLSLWNVIRHHHNTFSLLKCLCSAS